ncbi:hypothetical protein AMATHDRAFT_88766 [Amanita thiersii Skay4041]|uniref:Uncharacterized protein n=1 Tax=Amanita thiersii Skay4041 TaxID=703135 RepID=A0A2A9N8S8_9AGAR|nr:hypothetical protein AMATHDRAFT_88766 [Amanita thiersii Skay4041]
MATFSLADVGKSNAAYTNPEAILIRHARSEAQERLHEIQSSFQELDPAWEAQSKQIQQEINNYNIALAPHKRLPVELLSSIFILCAHECIDISPPWRKGQEDDNGSMEWLVDKANRYINTADETQFTLLRICKVWRQVAVSTSELWDSVRLSELDPVSFLIVNYLYSLNRTPKSLTLHVSCSDLTGDRARQLFTRYQYNYLGIYTEQYQSPLLWFIPYEVLSHLQELNLIVNDELFMKNDGSLGPFRLSNHQLPLLSSLGINGCGSSPTQVSLCCEKLRNLDFRSFEMPLHLSMDILHTNPLLEDVSFSIIPPKQDHVFSVMQEYINTSLTSLEVEFIDTDGSLEMFHRLRLPNLRKLIIRTTNKLYWITEIYPVLNRNFNFGELRILRLGTVENPIDVGLLLQNAPSLMSLIIAWGAVFTDQTMDGLATGRLGPKLRMLCADGDLDKDKVFSMVETRWKNSCQCILNDIHDADNTHPTPLQLVQLYCYTSAPLPEKLRRKQVDLEKLGVHVREYGWHGRYNMMR